MAAPANNSTPLGINSSSPPVSSFSRPQMFELLASKTCKVIWSPLPTGRRDSDSSSQDCETTGCFVQRLTGKIEVLTCFHDITWKTHKIEIIYQSHIYRGRLAGAINIDLAACYDVAVLEIDTKGQDFPFFDLSEQTPFPLRGEKVYFAGCPFGEGQPLVHKGYISFSDPISERFKLDGTVVRGHSGGPVAMINPQGLLTLVGIINSQLVDLTEQFLKIAQLAPPSVRPSNAPDVDYAGGHSSSSVINQLINNVLSNLSTGIGHATFISPRLIRFISWKLPPKVSQTTPLSSSSASQGQGSGSILAKLKITDEEWAQLKEAKQREELFRSQPLENNGAMAAFQSMLGPPISTSRPMLGPPIPTSRQPASFRGNRPREKVSELPVMRGEKKPSGASKYPEAFDWAHHMKTNKRAQFNAITGREDNKGREHSRGKDNISDDEFLHSLVPYYHYDQLIDANEDAAQLTLSIGESKLNDTAKAMLLQKLTDRDNPQMGNNNLETIKASLKDFENKLLESTPKARKNLTTVNQLKATLGGIKKSIGELPNDNPEKLPLSTRVEQLAQKYGL